MARAQVAKGGDGFQICRVAANILNKQSWTANMGWSSRSGIGRGANNPHRKKSASYKMVNRASDLDGFFGTTYSVGSEEEKANTDEPPSSGAMVLERIFVST
jgi:hypothetical protein